MRKSVVTGVILCGLAALAGRADDTDPEPPGRAAQELGKLKGTWTVTRLITGKRESKDPGMTYTFDGDRLMRTRLGSAAVTKNKREPPLTVKISARKKPHTIELVAAGQAKGVLGIYKIEGEMLLLALGDGGKAPADFSGKGGQVFVMRKLFIPEKKPKKDKK